jgi:hypothetical protein
MKAYSFKKIVYFKKDKTFANRSNSFNDAILYDDELSDETIKSLFDIDYQEQIEIWKVRVTIETI